MRGISRTDVGIDVHRPRSAHSDFAGIRDMCANAHVRSWSESAGNALICALRLGAVSGMKSATRRKYQR
jgi:hypothetical protein